MSFDVYMGIPEMRDLWNRLEAGAIEGTLDGGERDLAKKLGKAIRHLAANPFHPGLQSHEIAELSKRYDQKVFESYLENNTPAAGRLFWVYGPERGQITVIGLEPHPEDSKNSAYRRVSLSALPPVTKSSSSAKQQDPGGSTPNSVRPRRRRR